MVDFFLQVADVLLLNLIRWNNKGSPRPITNSQWGPSYPVGSHAECYWPSTYTLPHPIIKNIHVCY